MARWPGMISNLGPVIRHHGSGILQLVTHPL